jgi:hypothetical protein
VGAAAPASIEVPKAGAQSAGRTALIGAGAGGAIGGLGGLGLGVFIAALAPLAGEKVPLPVVGAIAAGGLVAGALGGGALGGVTGLLDRNGKLGGEGAATLGIIGAGTGMVVGGGATGALVGGILGAAAGFGVGKIID